MSGAQARRGARSRGGSPRDPARSGPRRGAKRTVTYYIRQLPRYVRLLGGLFVDGRVSIWDKLLVVGAIAYIVSPVDLIPDFIPFLGQVDDVYLLILALQRLIANTGRSVLLEHWSGRASDLRDENLQQALSAAAFFLPRVLRRRLRGRVRGR